MKLGPDWIINLIWCLLREHLYIGKYELCYGTYPIFLRVWNWKKWNITELWRNPGTARKSYDQMNQYVNQICVFSVLPSVIRNTKTGPKTGQTGFLMDQLFFQNFARLQWNIFDRTNLVQMVTKKPPFLSNFK